MSPLVENLHVALIPAKIIEVCLFILVILLINQKFKGTPVKKRPLLHQLFFYAMIGWTLYIFLDIFIFVFAAYSFEGYAPAGETLLYSGYDADYPSLFWMNIFRDFAMAGLITQVFLYLLVPSCIERGEQKTREVYLSKGRWLIPLILILVVVANDQIVVMIYGNHIRVDTDWNGIALFSLLFVIGTYLGVSFRIHKTLSKTAENQPSKAYKTQVKRLSFGIFVMGLGYIYMLMMGMIDEIFPVWGNSNKIWLGWIGHMIWASSPLFIYFGFKAQETGDFVEDTNDNAKA